jgi:hypothetical protein
LMCSSFMLLLYHIWISLTHENMHDYNLCRSLALSKFYFQTQDGRLVPLTAILSIAQYGNTIQVTLLGGNVVTIQELDIKAFQNAVDELRY